MAHETLKYEKQGAIGYVTLHRPTVMNAFNEQMGRDLVSVFGEMAENPDIRASILTGTGDEAFSAGADLKDTRTHALEVFADFLGTKHGDFFDAIANHPKPVIAAVNGYAVGAGFQIVLCCDMVLAAENAKFILPQVPLGIMPAYGGAVRLARFVGKGRAMEIVLTGKTVDAQEAYRIGLANQVVPLPELRSRARALADTLAGMPPLSVRLAKESLNRGLEMPLAHASNADLYRFFALVGTEDRKIGHEAARQQKGKTAKPQFKGR